MKVIFIVALFGFIALVASQTATSASVAVTDADLRCRIPDDCHWVQNSCNYGCGIAVNGNASARISTELYQLCPSGGAMSDVFCPPSYPDCVNGVCTIVIKPGPVVVDQSLQTCKDKSECTTFQPNCDGGGCCGTRGVVGISISNEAALKATWDKTCTGTPETNCMMVKCAFFLTEPTCVDGYCTINNQTAVITPPPPPPAECDPTTKRNELCQCVKSETAALGADWVCPLDCPGVPPRGCYCALSLDVSSNIIDGTSTLQYTCSPDACVDAAKPAQGNTDGCYCGVVTGSVAEATTNSPSSVAITYTPQWICPPAPCCSEVFTVSVDAVCTSSDAKVWCNPETCKWEYSCPDPPICTCDNIALPALDVIVDGCTTEQAHWYCSTAVGFASGGEAVVVSGGTAGNTAPPVKRQTRPVIEPLPPVTECAYWDYRCGETNKCVPSYGCGFSCHDASQPIPMAWCLPPDDPTILCEQQCLEKYAECVGYFVGNTFSCQPVKSSDYEVCVKSCHQEPPPPTDKCTYINDECNCKNAGCGWCHSTIVVDDPILFSRETTAQTSLSVGFCASLSSQFQCIASDNTFTVGESSSGNTAGGVVSDEVPIQKCDIVIPPEPKPLPVEPGLPDIDKCVLDNRCASPTDLNVRIQTAASLAPAESFINVFAVIIDRILNSDGGIVVLRLTVVGPREPLDAEFTQICKIVTQALSVELTINEKRFGDCSLSKITSATVKRQQSQSNHYIASMTVADNDSIRGSATALFPAFASAVALLALLF